MDRCTPGNALVPVQFQTGTKISSGFSCAIHKEVQSSTGCSQRARDFPLSDARRSGKVFDIKRKKF
jgi:hypothetical protein